MKKIYLTILFLFCFSAFANYQNPSLKGFLKEFQANPKEVMNQTPYKSYKGGTPTNLQLKSKISERKKLISFNKEQISGRNVISILFRNDENILTNGFEIDEKPLRKVKLIEAPWSGYYWSMRNGLIAYRYADKGFNWENNWEDRLDYVSENPMSSYLNRNKKLEVLSPAEKYDLLIGNYQGPLNSHMWDQGKKEIERHNEIREWVGLCHGLAMASLQLPSPKYSIKVKSADGKHLIKFYPEDIKALGSYHWSQDNIPLRMLGGRCEQSKVKTDANGRVIESDCRDPNPASFHLALVNRLGVQKKSLIMDSSQDIEVWNYPIVAYDFNFFNPNNGNKGFKLKNAMIPKADYKNDKFSKFRSPATEFIVGVEAKIDYQKSIEPEQEDKDSTQSKARVSVLYRYDLELDSYGNILGGEWYTNSNPDFIWFPEDSADPQAPFDYTITSLWNPAKEGLPADWIESANASAEKGNVSSKILKALFEYSHKGAN